MKNATKKVTAAVCAASVALLGACTPTVKVVFDEVKPWHDSAASYERLVFDTAIYDTTDENSHVTIATGKLTFELTENFETTAEGVPYTKIEMTSTVTYNDSAPEKDRGLTDTISSYVDFQSSGLAARRSEKNVTLADRAGVENLSYTVTADYFGTHTATRKMLASGEEKSLNIEQRGSGYYDNEMLFYLARATKMGAGSQASFSAVNLFDSFIGKKPKLVNYSFAVNTSKSPSVIVFADDDKNWVKNFGVEPVTSDDGTVTYPVPCYFTSIALSATKAGQPYVVHFSQNPFKQGEEGSEKSHGKIPMKISYSEYTETTRTRFTEYTLTELSFEK